MDHIVGLVIVSAIVIRIARWAVQGDRVDEARWR